MKEIWINLEFYFESYEFSNFYGFFLDFFEFFRIFNEVLRISPELKIKFSNLKSNFQII